MADIYNDPDIYVERVYAFTRGAWKIVDAMAGKEVELWVCKSCETYWTRWAYKDLSFAKHHESQKCPHCRNDLNKCGWSRFVGRRRTSRLMRMFGAEDKTWIELQSMNRYDPWY